MANNSSCLEFCKFLTEKDDWTLFGASFATFETFVAILTVIGNLIVLTAFLREKSLRREINFYIISLSFGDLCVGLVSIPLYLYKIDPPDATETCHIKFCLFKMAVLMTLSNVSMFNLVLISIKRLKVLSVQRPSVQQESTKKIFIQILCAWMFSTAIGTAPLYLNNNNPDKCQLRNILKMEFIIFRFVIATIVPVVIMGYVYFNIGRVIMKQAENKLKCLKSLNPSEPKSNGTMDKEIRATISIAIIVIVFCLTWVPSQILYVVSIYYSGCIPPFVVHIVMSLLLLNSAINPIIYAFRMRDIRKAIYRLFGIDRSSGDESSYPGSNNVIQ
ncbi:unnamed protein product [Chironomus riparius]|uniref:G-protein coupled receptors family 1 profile domain-containing protein n=1 Tax=Chironomus riparius TaxID=315576 RepID=A0A9N9RPB1_9DIPT|nr:unnamed protein product [Chironomus riparius]